MISLRKAEMLLQPSQGLVPSQPNIVQYLGSTVTSTCSMDKEGSNKLAKAVASFSRLWTWVLGEWGIIVHTKLAVHEADVIISMLYACETWTLYRRQLKTLEQFHLRCLCKIKGISWEDHRSAVQSQLARHWDIHHESTAALGWPCGWDGWHTLPEDGRLPQAGHWCTEHWVSTKGVQRQSEGIPWTVWHSQSWMQHTTLPGERTFETLKNRGCTT